MQGFPNFSATKNHENSRKIWVLANFPNHEKSRKITIFFVFGLFYDDCLRKNAVSKSILTMFLGDAITPVWFQELHVQLISCCERLNPYYHSILHILWYSRSVFF